MNNIQEADPFETASLAKTVYFIDPAHAGLAEDDYKRVAATAMF
jgi:hypothetical protein